MKYCHLLLILFLIFDLVVYSQTNSDSTQPAYELSMAMPAILISGFTCKALVLPPLPVNKDSLKPDKTSTMIAATNLHEYPSTPPKSINTEESEQMKNSSGYDAPRLVTIGSPEKDLSDANSQLVYNITPRYGPNLVLEKEGCKYIINDILIFFNTKFGKILNPSLHDYYLYYHVNGLKNVILPRKNYWEAIDIVIVLFQADYTHFQFIFIADVSFAQDLSGKVPTDYS